MKGGENVDDFTKIYQNYFSEVYRFCFAMCKNHTLAEELTQDTFFKALNSIDNFKGTCKIRVWLCQIAKNSYFSYYKKQKNIISDSEIDIEEHSSLEHALIQKDAALEIHKHLHVLEEPYKEVFTLRLFGELSYIQIAELFGKTESWARVTYHRARIKIKEKIL